MSIFFILDILLVLLILLFMPIGFWRGPVKELYVTLGILFGVLLADFWARPWGRDLTDFTDLTEGSGAFIIAMTFLVASTFVLGYGLGATLAPTYHSIPTKALGALTAAMNGTLLLSFSLQYVRLHLLSAANEESLDDSLMARFLLDQVGWVLMLAAIFAVPLLLFILISGRRAYDFVYEDVYLDEYAEEHEVEPIGYRRARTADAHTNVLPPRVPGTPREDETPYKTEPEPRRQRASAETRPLVLAEPRATAEPEQIEDEDFKARMGDTDPHIVLPTSQRARRDEAPEQAVEESAAATDDTPNESERGDNGLPPGYARCTACHAVLAPDISICPNCGTLR